MRWFFRIEYDGFPFSGWQSQNNAVSVQSTLQAAFSTVVRKQCRVTGAGRTDAGVHAAGQTAHIDLPDAIDIAKCAVSVNGILPREIAVRDFKPVDTSFHARFSAIRRTYKYYIVTRKSPLLAGRSWTVTHRINWRRMKENVKALIGRHDFRSFCAANHGARTTICTVYQAHLVKRGDMRIFTICADRYLYKMVRSIVGTLIDIGRGAIDDSVADIIKSKSRRRAGETAPACGLVLDMVSYKEV